MIVALTVAIISATEELIILATCRKIDYLLLTLVGNFAFKAFFFEYLVVIEIN